MIFSERTKRDVARQALEYLGVGEHCLDGSVDRVVSWVDTWKADAVRPPKLYFERTVQVDQMVIIRNIQFASLCEHHLLPFTGRADIAYFPGKMGVLGVSKFSRIVDHFAHRPQLQERLTSQIADFICKEACIKDVAVRLDAQHLCAKMRGVKQPCMDFVTSDMRGKFRENESTRMEFLLQIK
jgi:GTP cyclohydrolase I